MKAIFQFSIFNFQFSIILALFLTIASCGNKPKNDVTQVVEDNRDTEQVQSGQKEPEEADVNTSAMSIVNEAAFNGIFVLSPHGHATVTLSIDGIVKNISPRLPGEYVQKGELLATLENPEFINLQQNYLDACAQCEYLEAEYKRQEILSREDVASQKKLQQSKAEYLSMKSRKDAAATKLMMFGLSPQSIIANGIMPLLSIHAPISGYLSNLQINTGKHIAAGEPLYEIIDKNNILIKLTVYEKDLNRIKAGDKIDFSVNGMGDERFVGEIISIGQRVDNINRSLEVYAKVKSNNAMFRPGMYVNAQIVRR